MFPILFSVRCVAFISCSASEAEVEVVSAFKWAVDQQWLEIFCRFGDAVFAAHGDVLVFKVQRALIL